MDGLRGMACLLVLLAHSSEIQLFPYAPYVSIYGVKLFFVLSGFLMGLHYFPGALSVRYWAAFLTRRFFRIYPAYAFAMLTFWIFYECGIQIPLFWNFNSTQLIDQLMLKGGIMTYWSNIIEIKFYAAFPLLCLPFLLLPLRPAHTLYIVAVAWIGLLYVVDDPRNNVNLWEKLPCFIGGLLAALALPPLRFQTYVPPLVWNMALWLCAFLIVLTMQTWLLSYVPYANLLRQDWLIALLCTHLVLFTALATGATQVVFSNRLIRFIGLISYSLYVTHRITYGLTAMLPFFNVWIGAVFFLLEFGVAWLCYLAIEKPFIRLGKRLSARVAGTA